MAYLSLAALKKKASQKVEKKELDLDRKELANEKEILDKQKRFLDSVIGFAENAAAEGLFFGIFIPMRPDIKYN